MVERTIPTTIPAAVASAAREFGDAEALAEPGGRRLSYRELHERVGEVARALIADGIAPGDRVAVWCPNTTAWVLAALGSLTAGAHAGPGQHPVHRGRGTRRDQPQRLPGAVRRRRLPRRRPAGRAARRRRRRGD